MLAEAKQKICTLLYNLPIFIIITMLPFKTGKGASVIPVVLMVLSFVAIVVEFIVNKRWKTWKWSADKWLYVAMIALYMYIFIWQIGSDVFTRRFEIVIGDRIPLLLCGIIGLLGFSKPIKLSHVAYVFLGMSVLSSFYIILRGGLIDFITLPWMEKCRLFTLSRIAHMHNHMGYNIYLNISLILAFYLFLRGNLTNKGKILLGVCTAWIFFILLMTEGRIGFVTALFLAAAMICILLYKWGKWWIVVPMLLGFVAGGTLLVTNHHRLDIDHIMQDPRFEIWQSIGEVVKEEPIWGQGVCQTSEHFSKYITTHDDIMNGWLKNTPMDKLYTIHSHQSFLEAWAEFGLIGLFTLIFIFIYPLFLPPKRNRIFVFLIVAICVFQSLFDTLIIMLQFGLLIMFFTSQNEIAEANETQKPAAV